MPAVVCKHLCKHIARLSALLTFGKYRIRATNETVSLPTRLIHSTILTCAVSIAGLLPPELTVGQALASLMGLLRYVADVLQVQVQVCHSGLNRAREQGFGCGVWMGQHEGIGSDQSCCKCVIGTEGLS